MSKFLVFILAFYQPEFLDELERTMALLAFDPNGAGVGSGRGGTDVTSLFDFSQRQKTASELNAAILSSQCQEKGILNP